MKRLIILSVLMFWCIGCETEGLTLGFKDAPQHLQATMTGVTLSWPVMIGAGVVVWLVARMTSRKRKSE